MIKEEGENPKMNQQTVDQLVSAPNIISYMRTLLIVPLFLLYPNKWLTVIIILFAALSDMVDGFFLRQEHKVSNIRIIIAAVCDKLFLISATLLLFINHRLSEFQMVVLLLRDFYVTGIVIILVLLTLFDNTIKRFRRLLQIRRSGKITSVLIFISLLWIILEVPFFEYYIFLVLLSSVITIVDYSVLYARAMSKVY